MAVFALKLAGKRRQARRGGRFGRLVVRFALAACVALATVAAACEAPSANPGKTPAAIEELPSAPAATAAITAQPRAGPAQYTDLVLVDPGSDAQPRALLVAWDGDNTPILVDRVGPGPRTRWAASIGWRLNRSRLARGTVRPSSWIHSNQPRRPTTSRSMRDGRRTA